MARRKSPVAKKKTKKEKLPKLIPMLRPLGAEVRRLRLEKDLTQERLAEQARCSYKYLGRIELARANPTAVKLIRLARALGVTVGKLFETTTPGDTPIEERTQPLRKRATRRPSY